MAEDEDPATLRENVTSPGGTTAAGLRAIDGSRNRPAALMRRTIAAAAERRRGSWEMSGDQTCPANRLGRFRRRRYPRRPHHPRRTLPEARKARDLWLDFGPRDWRAQILGPDHAAIIARELIGGQVLAVRGTFPPPDRPPSCPRCLCWAPG